MKNILVPMLIAGVISGLPAMAKESCDADNAAPKSKTTTKAAEGCKIPAGKLVLPASLQKRLQQAKQKSGKIDAPKAKSGSASSS